MIEPDTREGWEEFFAKHYDAIGLKIVDLDIAYPDEEGIYDGWQGFIPVFTLEKKKEFESRMLTPELQPGGVPIILGGMPIRWVVHCLECNRWFIINNRYQTECRCGNPILALFFFPPRNES